MSFAFSVVFALMISCSPLEDGLKPADSAAGLRTAALSEATFVDPTATLEGRESIRLGKQVYVGPFARLIAGGGDDDDDDDEESAPQFDISIGNETNVQDNVTIIANFERDGSAEDRVEALGIEGVEIAERVILAHGSTVKGPARIGVEGSNIPADPADDQEVFLSFGCEVDGAILEKNTGVSALARVGPGVRLKSGFIVLPGKNVTTQAEADNPSLGKVRLLVEADVLFNEDVLEVNAAFAREYTRLAQENPSNVRGINYDPGNTEFNPNRDLPRLNNVPSRVPSFRNRIIGDVRIGNTFNELNQRMGNRISIRADEGEPFTVGRITRVDNNVIFHALKETPIVTGNNVSYGERSIVHGGGRRPLLGGGDNEPTIIEDNVRLLSQAVVFRSLIGRGATIGRKTAIVNTDVAPGQVIGDRLVYVNNSLFGRVEW